MNLIILIHYINLSYIKIYLNFVKNYSMNYSIKFPNIYIMHIL